VKRELNQGQEELVSSIWHRYVRYKEEYVEDGWEYEPSNAATHNAPGFPRNVD
jgi:hypothetical protein